MGATVGSDHRGTLLPHVRFCQDSDSESIPGGNFPFRANFQGPTGYLVLEDHTKMIYYSDIVNGHLNIFTQSI